MALKPLYSLLVLGALSGSFACWTGSAAAEDAPPIDAARAEAISRKIDEINTQLSKLDQIVEQLRRLRTEELPKLQRELRGAGEASVLVNRREQTVQKPELPGDDVVPAGATEKANETQQTLESQLAAVGERLQQLDEVSQQITALRTEDLPRLQAELNRLKGGAGVERKALRPVPNTQGRLVINNLSGLTRDVTVNDITYTIRPGAWQVPVPYREVTTQLSAGEIPHLWGSAYWRQSETGPEMRLELK